MEQIYLNIGCGQHKLQGFINIDFETDSDLQLDVREGLPYPNDSVDGIFSEHFIEHITQADGIAFLRECRRVLKPIGRIRIATPDLDYTVKRYLAKDFKKNEELCKYGYDWVSSSCEEINLSMREWGHQYLYNQRELIKSASIAGLNFLGRYELGKSDEPSLCNLEYRQGSRLIVEFKKKERIYHSRNPLVSILIPAYNPTYFRESLESTLEQSYENLEIIICDDSTTGEIGKIVEEYAVVDSRIRYIKNQKNIGSQKNFFKCFSLAKGDFIKYLSDDALLHPICVERMANYLKEFSDVTLVTSHRQLIDDKGQFIPEQNFTVRPIKTDGLIDGIQLANMMLSKSINFIGDPTTTMFRKSDLERTKPDIFSYGGRSALANGDVTMWVNLLGQGDAIYLVDSLSYFRIHKDQEQHQPDFAKKEELAWQQIIFDAKRMGFLRPQTFRQNQEQQMLNVFFESRNLAGAKQFDKAIKILKEIPHQNLHIGIIMNELAILYFKKGEMKKAFDHFESAIKADPNNIIILKNYADFCVSQKDFQRAQKFYERILKIDKQDEEALVGMVKIYYYLNNFAQAEQWLDKLHKIGIKKSLLYKEK